jgi:hypothetical protein
MLSLHGRFRATRGQSSRPIYCGNRIRRPSCLSADTSRAEPSIGVLAYRHAGAGLGDLLRSKGRADVVGLRDRALTGVMVFTFARISAACDLNVGDIFHQQRRLWVRLHEKGSKLHDQMARPTPQLETALQSARGPHHAR